MIYGFLRKFKERVTKQKANISLNFNKDTFNLGENLEGILKVTSEEVFDALWTRIEFRCVKKRKRDEDGMSITAVKNERNFGKRLRYTMRM